MGSEHCLLPLHPSQGWVRQALPPEAAGVVPGLEGALPQLKQDWRRPPTPYPPPPQFSPLLPNSKSTGVYPGCPWHQSACGLLVKPCLAYKRCSSPSRGPTSHSPARPRPRPRRWSLLGPSWVLPAPCLGLGLGSVPPAPGIPGAGCRDGHSQHSGEGRAASCSQVLVHGGGGSQSRHARPAVQRRL